jgi:crossover junction endodeoxyribonuclease RuvC
MKGIRIVGLDPGLTLTGYGVIGVTSSVIRTGKPSLVEAGVFRMNREDSLADRLAELHSAVADLLDEHKPGAVAVEELYSHYDRPRTAILMGHARGVLLLAAALRKIPVASYLPTRVKKLMTGNGHAAKSQMQQAVRMEFDLPGPVDPPDVADALAVALCHFHATRRNLNAG